VTDLAELPAGTLTPGIVARALDEMWHPGRPACPPGSRDPIEDLPAPLSGSGSCRAALFAPDESLVLAVRAELILRNTPVHPLDLPYLAPAQGPAPLACARGPHPDGTWHWDGRGTWFRAGR